MSRKRQVVSTCKLDSGLSWLVTAKVMEGFCPGKKKPRLAAGAVERFLSDRDNDKPNAPPSASNPYADAHAKSLYDDREKYRGQQRWLNPRSPEYQKFQKQIDAIDRQLRELGRLNVSPARTSSDKRKGFRRPKKRTSKSRKRKVSNPEVIKRRAIVAQNLLSPAIGLCRLFDEAKCPLPKTLKEFESWERAYLSRSPACHAIESLISRDRKAVQETRI